MQLDAVDGRARDPGGSPFACRSGCARPRERRAVGARPDQQRRRVSPAWLVTQAERKPPSTGRAVGRRLLVSTNSGDVFVSNPVAAFVRGCRVNPAGSAFVVCR